MHWACEIGVCPIEGDRTMEPTVVVRIRTVSSTLALPNDRCELDACLLKLVMLVSAISPVSLDRDVRAVEGSDSCD